MVFLTFLKFFLKFREGKLLVMLLVAKSDGQWKSPDVYESTGLQRVLTRCFRRRDLPSYGDFVCSFLLCCFRFVVQLLESLSVIFQCCWSFQFESVIFSFCQRSVIVRVIPIFVFIIFVILLAAPKSIFQLNMQGVMSLFIVFAFVPFRLRVHLDLQF